MSGRIIEVAPKRGYDFSVLEPNTGGGYNDITAVIAERIDVSAWRDVALVVRVYDVSIAGANDSLKVSVVSDGWTPDTPSDLFIGSEAASLVLGSSDSAPEYLLASLTDPFGPRVAVKVGGIRGNTTSGSSLTAMLSIALSVND